MSLFRKPKKIQRRVFCADDDDDGEPEPPPPPVISRTKENKPVKCKTLLSFADEEEDGEVFKVKKSSQSKRLSKRREKEKKKEPENDIIKNDFEDHEMPEARSPEKPKKKKVTLEGLILSGRAALAAGGSDAESSGSGSGAEGEGGFHTYRADSVRAALRPGHIPDAALIHAARKTRQQARELGDFVPVRDTEDSGAGGGGRLAREDDDDDDDDEGRIHVRGLQLPSDKPERDTEAAEVESAGEEWEEQQLQKARPAIMDVTGESAFPLNPFSVPAPPPPPRMERHLRPLALLQPKTAQELIDALKTRVQELSEERDSAARRVASVRERVATSVRVRDACNARQPQLQRAYTRAQAARGYFTDLVECLDEKLPALEAVEARALALHRRRCEYLTERRRADVRDQAQDVLAMAARAGSSKVVDSEDKVRRTAEREGRRRARRLARAAAGAAPDAHRDGDSSDDQLPPHELQHRRTERESIAAEAAGVFSDVSAAWGNARGVCGAAAAWRRRALYRDAYVAACLPRLLGPYVRHQLILWNPLSDEDDDDYEKMDWYRTLMMYGVKSDQPSDGSESDDSLDEEVTEVTETSVREDQDLMLVPNILTKVVIPKLTELVEHAFDPMCVRSCVRLRQLLIRFSELPGAAPPLAKLSAAIRARIVLAINADVFLPTLPPQIVEGPGALFWRRCAGAGVRLLRGVLALTEPPLLRADSLALDVIDRLCTAAGAAPGGAAAWAASVLAQSVPRAAGLRTRALRRLAGLARTAAARLDVDNPLHMKPLEQVRTLLAEAKVYEV